MLSNRNNIFILCCVLMFCSCKPRSYLFTFKKNITKDFFMQAIQDPAVQHFSLKSVKVYRAYIEERLVEREDVPEYKLINKESHQTSESLVASRNHHELFLFELLPDNKQLDTVYIFLATTFNSSGKCLGVGPAYLGFLRINQLWIKKELKISDKKNVYQLRSGKKADMIFQADQDLPQPSNTTSIIRLKKIIQLEPNKIGGLKPEVFNIETVFNDPDALVFTFYTNIDN